MKTKSKVSGYIIRSAALAVLLLPALVTLGSAFNLPSGWSGLSWRSSLLGRIVKPATQTKTVTFADRVAYQRAIEDIYWRHRIWPAANGGAKPSLNEVMSQAQIENKVKDYLRNSQALADYWQQPITPDQLQAEMERMAQHTKQPGVLRELFAALDNDPFVVAECLARPVLAERLVEALDSHGQKFPDDVKVSLETRVPPNNTDNFESQRAANPQMPIPMSAQSDGYTLPEIPDVPTDCADAWTATTTTGAPTARTFHSAVWTGSEMIVWGGDDSNSFGNTLNTGGRYNPSTDSWTATTTTSAPLAREDHTAVWTGTEMIVWGGVDFNTHVYFNTGGRYNPTTNTWTATTTVSAPSGRYYHSAVWTGSQMAVWGGQDAGGNYLNTGAKYTPGTNSWTATSTTSAPTGRFRHTVIWSGTEMIVWGGWNQATHTNFNSGGRYNPVTDAWTATSTTSVPDARFDHTAVWTGTEMIVWGGLVDNTFNFSVLNSGGKYNPSTDSWLATSTTGAPPARSSHTAVWTNDQMIVWGGASLSGFFNSGARYTPGTDTWSATTTTTGAPSARYRHVGIWTGSKMVVWGGSNGSVPLNTGGQYCAQASPTPTPTATATFTPTATVTATFTPTATATATATFTPTPTATATFTPTATATATATATFTPTPTPTPTATSTPNATATCAPTPSGMISWWPGNGDANDIVGGNNGVLQNGATFATGEVGQAFSLDGVDDNVLISDSPSLNYTDFTYDAWIAPDPDSAAGDNYIICKGAVGYYVPLIAIAGGAGAHFWEVFLDDVILHGPPVTYNFEHLAVTREGTTAKLYVDGDLIDTQTVTTANSASGYDLEFGNIPGFNLAFFKGRIDEVEIFNRALTQSEIQSIYNAGSAGKCTPSPTPTATATATFTPTATATATFTPTATATFTPTPTATATFTPTATATATFTPTPTATATFTPTPTATATFTPTPTPTPTPVRVIVQTSPAGLSFTVDGTTYTAEQRFSWIAGSSHTIATTSPQSGGTGVRYVWFRWNDNGAISHTVAPTTNVIYTTTFGTQYFLTMAHGTGGRVSPNSGWRNSEESLSISATPAPGYHFTNWTGSGTDSYSGTNNPASITMNSPITETATFTHN